MRGRRLAIGFFVCASLFAGSAGAVAPEDYKCTAAAAMRGRYSPSVEGYFWSIVGYGVCESQGRLYELGLSAYLTQPIGEPRFTPTAFDVYPWWAVDISLTRIGGTWTRKRFQIWYLDGPDVPGSPRLIRVHKAARCNCPPDYVRAFGLTGYGALVRTVPPRALLDPQKDVVWLPASVTFTFE